MTDNTVRLSGNDIGSMSSMTQGFDNQYVPLSGLKKMEKKKLSREGYRQDISDDIKAEFRRALLYSDSVVINRAFFTNTREIYQPLLTTGEEKDSFLQLVNNKAIVPYLYRETSVLEEDEIYRRDDGVKAMTELVRAVGQVPCVRLSWNEKENLKGAYQLAKAYTNYVMSARIVADAIASDLGIKDVEGFKQRLNKVTRYCLDEFEESGDDYITRQKLYAKFICVEGSTDEETKDNITRGIYDFQKPFWRELKLIFDLKYQANLTDKLRIQTFSASDLPERAALRELDMIALGELQGEIIDLPLIFSEVVYGTLQKGLWLARINDLSFQDMLAVRALPEYRRFIKASCKLKEDAKNVVQDTQKAGEGVDKPLPFSEFYKSFCDYQQAIAKKTMKKSAENIKPVINTIIKIAGVTLTFSAQHPVVKVAGAIGALEEESATLVAKVFAGAAKEIDLALDFDFMRTRIANAKAEYHKLISKLEKNGYKLQETIPKQSGKGTLSAEQTRDYPDLGI
jgi:hypothetical protein